MTHGTACDISTVIVYDYRDLCSSLITNHDHTNISALRPVDNKDRLVEAKHDWKTAKSQTEGEISYVYFESEM